ncbi:hypothetical protein Q664_24205 [Archangium violaceum Cb vi76]|uniref:Lipoprotein n=2 Tax=Archangium violaceum TaxID=83451 RepID=A0A084SRP6_9BACT|nr:hypothetical protein Q664_24205 [Archangium violaceum Cb vi76]
MFPARPVGPVVLALAMLVLLAGCGTGHPRGSLTSGFGLHSRSASRRPATTPVLAETEGSAGGFPGESANAPWEEHLWEGVAQAFAPAPLSCAGMALPPGWPDLASSDEELLAPLWGCSPAEFLQVQQRVDMPRLLEALEDWGAVRLGALGPVREDAVPLLQRKRVAFLLTTTELYGLAYAEVFALFVLHSAHDDEVREMLRLLAGDKQLGQTLGLMPAVREELEARGLPLPHFPDRAEQASDILRGLGRAARDALSSSETSGNARYTRLHMMRGQLPPPYQRAFDEVNQALRQRHFAPGHVVVGTFDSLTFGVPLGFFHLVAGTGHGAYTLSQGQYEQASRELAPATLLVALYAGGKGLRALSQARGGTGLPRGLPPPEQRMRALQEMARQLEETLGVDGLRELARDIRSSREAGQLVAVGGVDAALALREARGNVARAQAWLSQRRPERASPTEARGGAGKGPGEVTSLADDTARSTPKTTPAARHQTSLSSLVDEQAGLTPEVVEAKWLRVELESSSPRLPGNVELLEKQRPVLEAPPPGAQSNPRWSEYVTYYEKRLGEMRQGTAVKPPLAWAGYERMRGWFARGLAFERIMVEMLRIDAQRPRAERRFLGDFLQPRIETYVGVRTLESGLRFADVLVIEESALAGTPPRVETFSFKSRDFSLLDEKAFTAQMIADAREALRYYGGTLDIRRPSLQLHLREGSKVPVPRLRLIYEGGSLKPKNAAESKRAVNKTENAVPGVEVSFQ